MRDARLAAPPAREHTRAGEGAAPRPRPGDRSAPHAAGVSMLVDARAIHASGIGRYLREVLGAVLADPRFARVELLGEPEALHAFRGGVPGGEKVSVRAYSHGFYSPSAQAAWLGLRLRGAAAADVSFFPHYDAPLFALPSRSVVTVHDLIHFKVPEAFSPWRRFGARALLRRGVSAAGGIITVSEATRRDLVERFPSVAGKVRVVPNGVSPFFRPCADGAACDLPTRSPYLLCVGNRKPHKNLAAAVEALALLREERPELLLVVVGDVFEGWEAVLQRAGSLGVRERILDVSAAGDTQLRCLYTHAEALLFPSLYEGFGLPVLEAMACGAPVVASNRSSLPEVVGDAGVLVDPGSPREMADAVLRLRREPGLREDLVRRGRARAAAFGWERSAHETADLLYRVATERR